MKKLKTDTFKIDKPKVDHAMSDDFTGEGEGLINLVINKNPVNVMLSYTINYINFKNSETVEFYKEDPTNVSYLINQEISRFLALF